jgi:L-asparagine transporter-like permease
MQTIFLQEGGELVNYIGVFFILGLILLCIVIAFLTTLSSTIKAVQPANRTISPSQVYLMLIPLFNYIWIFIMVSRIADSIEKEFKSRNIIRQKPTYSIGLAYAILTLSCVLINYILPREFLMFFGIIWLATLICFISYWVSISNVKNELHNSNSFSYNTQSSSNTPPHNNSGYQGQYSGGHNNHNNAFQSPNQNHPNDNNGEYKSGDLYS